MRLLILPLLYLCFCSASQAADRFYVGARLGTSHFDGTADASRNTAFGPGVPTEISIDGLVFESDETIWGVYGGWRVKDWFALELGLNDLGNTGRESFVSIGGLSSILRNGVALDVQEMFLASRFTLSLPRNWNANWIVGISQATFDTEGALPWLVAPISTQPRPLIPYASPDSETGFIWGFGFGWDVSDHWSLDIGYRQHNTQVIDVDTFDIGAVFSF